MTPIDLLSLLISAVLLAGLYATMSYGLALIYGVMKIVNLSHAGFMMFGAYAAFVLIAPDFPFRLNPFAAPLVIVPVFFVLGMLVQRFIVRHVMNAPMITSLLLLFGVWLIMQNTAYIRPDCVPRITRAPGRDPRPEGSGVPPSSRGCSPGAPSTQRNRGSLRRSLALG